MNDQTRSGNLSPQTKQAQGGVGAPHLHQDGPDGDSGDRRIEAEPADRGDAQRHERKDAGWPSRQGGSQDADR